jgi:hypothetical protein
MQAHQFQNSGFSENDNGTMLFLIPGRRGYKEALPMLRFLCARGVKHFSKRTQRLQSGRNVYPGKRRQNQRYFFFNQVHYKGTCFKYLGSIASNNS